MYFRDRTQAGELLASQLLMYQHQEVAVLALSPGGAMVGEPIARALGCSLSMLLTARISAPGEASLILGTINQEGDFAYNNLIPAGEMEEYMEDMRNYLEEEKLHQMYHMATVMGAGGFVNRDQLRGKIVILATDGVKNGLSIEGAMHFLKPIHIQKVIAAVPVGPGETIERLIQKCDELHYLYIPDNFLHVGHYYEDKNIENPEVVIKRLEMAG